MITSSIAIRTEDGVTLHEGDLAYDYYSMKPGRIARITGAFGGDDIWFDFEHSDGTVCLLNGQRICSVDFAQFRGFKNA